MKTSLPDELKGIVYESVLLLGSLIKEQYGADCYDQIERIRLSFKHVRDLTNEKLYEVLNHSYVELSNVSEERLIKIAHVNALMLELVNCCESAYRVVTIKKKPVTVKPTDQQIIFVLTSHPTEARSKNFLLLVEKITDALVRGFENDFSSIREELKFLLSLALSVEITKHLKPTIRDEFSEIYQRILSKKMLDKQIELFEKGIEVSFRTWSGGDKDGHPGVGSAEMLGSLEGSRLQILDYIKQIFESYRTDLTLVYHAKKINLALVSLLSEMDLLRKIEKGDGIKITRLRKKFNTFLLLVKSNNLYSPDLSKVKSILWLYPALVMPLEIREDSNVVALSLGDKKQSITRMLLELKKIAQGFDPKWYVRGFIVSMCQTSDALSDGISLVKKCLGSYSLPVIPLFENEQGMRESLNILDYNFKKHGLVVEHSTRWNNKYEVMVGYSDSSKENGVLPARLQLENAIKKIDSFISSHELRPVFFHGSGGSISRGGGSTKEQIAWWPISSLSVFKMTVQGESIQRNLGHPLLLESAVFKITDEFNNFSTRSTTYSKSLDSFVSHTKKTYNNLVNDKSFQALVCAATPYQFLDQLKLGSRPDKRNSPDSFSLRAIPWILCWTQTRILLPVWWGVGSSWSELSNEDKQFVKNDFSSSPLLASYLKHLGFTLEKIRISVWHFLIDKSNLEDGEKKRWIEVFYKELNLTESFFHEVSGGKDHLWFRPWLRESIYFRSSMIHPLNVIQKISLEKSCRPLLRTTVAGISSGMLTTG